MLLLSTFLCEETLPAKNTLRIPLLTDTCKNKTSLKAWRDETARSTGCGDLSVVLISLGPWQPFDLSLTVSDPGGTDRSQFQG